MSEKWIDLGPESNLVTPADVVTAVDATSSDAQVPSAKCLNTMAGDIEEALRIVRSGRVGGWIYGYVIDESDSNPATRVSYIEDNADFDPLYMDFTNDALVWGSWKDFVEEYFKPAMLKSDGTIDYYLNPYDLTKKADGVTASDVANTSYDGNAMLIVKPIFYNIGRVSPTQIRVRFSNVKQGDDWFNWTHLKSDGTYADFCGWPLFEGGVHSSKLRSLSGLTPNANDNGFSLAVQYSHATANGSNWHLTTFADEMLIRMLVPLLLRSTNSEACIGRSSQSTPTTGAFNAKGYFYGSDSASPSTPGNKFLCMENFWADKWRRCIGAANIGAQLYVKLTPSTADGTSAQAFATSSSNSDYSGYFHFPYALSSCSGVNCTRVSANPFMATIPTYAAGSSFDTHYCDYVWWTRDASVNGVCFGGGGSNNNGAGGAFAIGGNLSVNSAFDFYNASLSYHFY